MNYKIDGKKLFTYYLRDLCMSVNSAAAAMPAFDYSLPVEHKGVPALGMVLVKQGTMTAIVPSSALYTPLSNKQAAMEAYAKFDGINPDEPVEDLWTNNDGSRILRQNGKLFPNVPITCIEVR